MDSKILTLFDDEDFHAPLPKPRTAKKGKPVKDETPVDPATVMETGHDEIPLPDTREKAIVPEAGEETDNALKRDDADILDEQIKAALIQADYTLYVHKEMPAEPQQQVKGSGIVFEGVVARKKTEPMPVTTEMAPVRQETMQEVPPEENSEALPEWELESRYYSIGEVAKLFGVNNSHIRFWTTQFKLNPRTTRKGDRLYNVDDINQLRLIHHLVKEKKHTIKGAKEKLKDKDVVEVKLDLKTSLTKLKDILTEMRDNL